MVSYTPTGLSIRISEVSKINPQITPRHFRHGTKRKELTMYIIWNLTRLCPWNCKFCCVSAIHTIGKNGKAICSKQREKELPFTAKMEILRMIADNGMTIDFSGGDPLYFSEDYGLVEKATQLLPPKNINVSITGSKITRAKIELLKKVNMVEFTLDNLPETENPFRPRGFNIASMKAMQKLVNAGIKVSAVTILYSQTANKENLRKIYFWLCENGIQEWDILKYYPVGRGLAYKQLALTDEKYLKTMSFLRSLDGFTHIFFQHSLRVIEGISKCHATINSIGILPDGQATACAWALKDDGSPFEKFKIGKLPEEKLDDILKRSHTNLGFNKQKNFCRITRHCQIEGNL